MPTKHHKPEEIVAKLRQVDVLVSQGQNIADAIRQIGVSEVTYYRWRQEFGGLKTDQVKRLKELETERSDSTSITSIALSLRATRIARHSWVNSSITLSIRYLLPSWVRSSTKS